MQKSVIDYVVALTDIRASQGKCRLSGDAARILALLISMPSPDPKTSIDRSHQYKDCAPATLLQQLNENWKQLRLFKSAIDDRNRTIATLHESIAQRDQSIKLLNARLRYAKVRIALMYSLVGGAAAQGTTALAQALFAFLRHAH